MAKIRRSKQYRRSFEKLPQKIKVKAKQRVALFLRDRNDPLLADHPLTGRMQGLRSFSVTGDYRIVYRIEENDEIVFLFLDIGTHAQVYR